MIKIEIKNIDSNITETEIIEARLICYDLSPVSLKHKIYVEFWSDHEFRSYFSCGQKTLEQPLGPDKLVEGFHDFSNNISSELVHSIAIIKNDNWKITLRHEMVHVYCAEILGIDLWYKYMNMFKSLRSIDPFEYIAIALADTKISEETIKNSINNRCRQ